MALPELDRGDFLTFASIGGALGMGYSFYKCEVSPGVWRRRWDLLDHESRSDISRDGYIGVMFYAAFYENKVIISRIISAGWKRRWTMGDRGNFDYVNIWPLVPYLYALKYGSWVPTPKVFIIGKVKTGFRAHLAAMIIMLDFLIGKPYSKHKSAIKKLVEYNPENLLFLALDKTFYSEITIKSPYDWGGCSPEMHLKLANFARVLVSKL